MYGATQIVIESGSLFALLNGIAEFIKESCQRMNVWEEPGRNKRRRCLAPIGETRRWAKHEALKKVFGSFTKLEDGLYVDLLLTLSAIQKQATVKPCSVSWPEDIVTTRSPPEGSGG